VQPLQRFAVSFVCRLYVKIIVKTVEAMNVVVQRMDEDDQVDRITIVRPVTTDMVPNNDAKTPVQHPSPTAFGIKTKTRTKTERPVSAGPGPETTVTSFANDNAAAASSSSSGESLNSGTYLMDKLRLRQEFVSGRRGGGGRITLKAFHDALWPFKTLLFISGLHMRTATVYRQFLRVVLWCCVILCAMNLGLKTRSYRNPLFDIMLSALHMWVAMSYERWRVFLNGHHWRNLLREQSSASFFQVISRLGWCGIAIIPLACALISGGWMIPILQAFVDHEANVVFLAFHGLLMIVIVVPWACVCITTAVCFYLVANAHVSDMDRFMDHFITHSLPASSHGTSPSSMSPLRKTIRGMEDALRVRMRLNATCEYFSAHFLSFILVFFGMVLAAVYNIATAYTFASSAAAVLQDGLFIGLGTIALYCGLWTASSVGTHWRTSVVQDLNNMPTQHAMEFHDTDLVVHQAFVHHLECASVDFIIYGLSLNRTTLMTLFMGMGLAVSLDVFLAL